MDVFLQYLVEILLDRHCLMRIVLVIPGTGWGHGCDALAAGFGAGEDGWRPRLADCQPSLNLDPDVAVVGDFRLSSLAVSTLCRELAYCR